jgi:hypothetical protein
MRNICRRIEALNNATSVNRNLELQIGDRAMNSLWPSGAEDLLRAYGADRAGRPLTESEAEAKRLPRLTHGNVDGPEFRQLPQSI